MKKVDSRIFGNIICNVLLVIWQDFVNVWKNTPCTIWSTCSGMLTALVLSKSLIRWYNTACLRERKFSCHTTKNWCNFKRFNTILNSEILLNLIRKMKYLTDEFQFRFCFCIVNIKELHFIFALAAQLASLQTTCYKRACVFLSLHSGI